MEPCRLENSQPPSNAAETAVSASNVATIEDAYMKTATESDVSMPSASAPDVTMRSVTDPDVSMRSVTASDVSVASAPEFKIAMIPVVMSEAKVQPIIGSDANGLPLLGSDAYVSFQPPAPIYIYHVPTNAQPPRPDVDYLQGIFANVDKEGSGKIDATKLQYALSNETWKPFNLETVRMMINIFDRSRTGTIGFEDFVSLWNYINDWMHCFQEFDESNSGFIDKNQLRDAMNRFGYRLSEQTLNTLFAKYQKERKGFINLDSYILCCVSLQTLSNAFRSYDTDRDGWINISYDQSLKLALSVMP
ncbi:hypothetical protein V5799_004615 [Amblyomma americanum]|uniref:EF-hand domain-containing protein n=1 Tax=Amblyomma americanum TaxID=6943 RepID=A0AAQ4D5L5_AMBAM